MENRKQKHTGYQKKPTGQTNSKNTVGQEYTSRGMSQATPPDSAPKQQDTTTRNLFQKVDSIEYWKTRGRDAMRGAK